MCFNILYPIDHIRFSPPYSPGALREAATTPCTTRLTINVLSIFTIDVSSPQGTALTVYDVLGQLFHAMARQPQGGELARFPPDVQQRAMAGSVTRSQRGQPAYIRRAELLGPRVLFSGLEIVQLANGTAFCELHLAPASR